MASLDDRIARKETELEALNARKAARVKKEAELNENLRTYAGMTLAGFVWKELGLTYDTFDMERFAEQFAEVCHRKYANGAPVFDCAAEVSECEKESEKRKAVRQRYRDHIRRQKEKGGE